jgi:hypothetical protein
LLDLELPVADDGSVRLDHLCAGAEMHRLLGVQLSDAEQAVLRADKEVRVVVACDRCLWERRLVLRRAAAEPARVHAS